ncbi:N-acetyl sugar amidotransferase [Terasakiella sp. SH-1]|uniref:N-acetyl sugar amidotransferase n=1 Tax=Terasakiella sp. SH-1 TaxID=2560057 RepID=UPI0010744E0B|nr:N-acetyl sugar amidotransferase [Terasakiella sp. SH-1]
MTIFKAFQEIDYSQYEPLKSDNDAFFGLPKEVQYCNKCVISNQRPNSAVEFSHTKNTRKTTISFDEEGICDACQVAEDKLNVNWADRAKELEEVCNKYRKNDGTYDVLVPGSGGKDSFYTAHILKYKFGMNPLTVTFAPHIYTDWGYRNLHKWIDAGFDNYLFTPNKKIHRLLTRLATETIFHPFQPFMLGQKNMAPKLAAQFNIPFVVYGENEAEYGNPRQDMSTAKRSHRYYTTEDPDKVYIAGVAMSELLDKYGLTKNDLEAFMPANPGLMSKVGVDVHYLGYYMKWHPQECYYYSVEHGDFEACPERNTGTFSKYASIDDKIDDLHWYSTFIKFGIGRCSYDAAQEIRSRDIERVEGVALVKRFDGEYPERFFDTLMDYLSIDTKQFPNAKEWFESPEMTKEYFNNIVDRNRSPHIWHFKEGQWGLRKPVWKAS